MPRSPSRDRSDRYAGDRGYFRRVTPLARAKVLLSVVGLVAAVAWSAADATWPDRMRTAHTHGELADPHAAWATDCHACHRPFHPGSDTAPLAAGARWQDFSCGRCHGGSAHHAPHPDSANASLDIAFHNGCGNCHHDHNGRTASLTRIADSHCTRCHSRLDSHPAATPMTPAIRGTITHFATDHPDFRGLNVPAESRTLKFSHALHLTPGVVKVADADGALTPARMTELFGWQVAERYREFVKEGVVQLDCRACHQLDAGAGGKKYDELAAALGARGEPARSVLPVRAGGAHFLPVNFEAHCQACHPTQAPPKAFADAGVVGAKGLPLPHRRPWRDMPDEVTTAYLKQLLREDNPALTPPTQPGLPPDEARKAEAKAIRTKAEEVSKKVMEDLAGKEGCMKCHDLTPKREIAPIPSRSVWLPGARFDHTAHRAAKCLDCHPGTQAAFIPLEKLGGGEWEKEAVKKNILGVESCKSCHTPPVGVRHNCTDCHSYHDGGHPLRGRGSTGRAPTDPPGLPEFLRK